MKAYKGFNKDMTCRGFQFEEGKEYHEDNADLCKSGFHACEDPIDCLNYYSPNKSIYREVELSDTTEQKEEDSKRVGKTIKIGAEIDIAKICKLHFEYAKEHSTINHTEENQYNGGSASTTYCQSAASATGNHGIASATGWRGSASATGWYGAACATGWYGAASATGNHGTASATGRNSAACATGDHGTASSTGDQGAACATGRNSAACATGDHGTASSTGDQGAASATGKNGAASVETGGSVALTVGLNSKAKAGIGSAICICERAEWNGKEHPLIAIKAAIVDGKTLKADTWYKLKNGEFVEANDEA